MIHLIVYKNNYIGYKISYNVKEIEKVFYFENNQSY